MSDKVIPLEELGKKGTVKVYNQAYVEELEAKIAYLTRHLEPQSMTALFEQVEEEVNQEQKIKELEAYNEKLLNGDIEKHNKIVELEKENAELKEKLEIEENARGDWFGKAVTKDRLLTEAKEIIRGLMRFCRCFAQHHTEDIRYKDAEEFLKEDINE